MIAEGKMRVKVFGKLFGQERRAQKGRLPKNPSKEERNTAVFYGVFIKKSRKRNLLNRC